MKSYAVKKASMAFGIIDNDIVSRHQRINGRNDTLITEIK